MTDCHRNLLVCMLAGVFLSGNSNAVNAQNSSLFQRPFPGQPDTGANRAPSETLPAPNTARTAEPLATAGQVPGGATAFGGVAPASALIPTNGLGLQTAWSYVPPTPPRVLKLYDIVHVRVEEASTSLALGNTSSRKTTSYDAVLKDWVKLVGIDTVQPAPQAQGDPRIQGTQNEVYRGDSTMRTSESFTTNIAAEVVDIRPNGLVVLNARKKLINNDNTYEISLTGTCRSQDIDASNTVLSRHLIHAEINKQDQGHVRDGYSRGWLTKLIARIKPF